MNDLKIFLISEEAKLVYVIALVISITYITFYYFRKTKQQRLQKQNTMQLKKTVGDVKLKDNKKKEKISSDSSTLVVEESPVFIKEDKKTIKENIELVKPIEEQTKVQEKEIYVPVINNKIDKKAEVKEEIQNNNTTNIVVELDNNIIEETKVIKDTIKKTPFTDNKTKADKMDALLNKLYQTSVENIKNKNVEEITYVNTIPNEEEAKKELEEVTKKLEQAEESKNIELTEFEKMQEDTAIISLDELMKKAGEMYSYNEEVQYKDEGNEPISLADLDNRKKSVLEVKEEIDEIVTIDDFNITITPVEEEVKTPLIQKENKKFVPSSVISPVYGMSGEFNKNTDLELENTANYEKLDEEIRKTNEFMATLKELQKKLD